MTIRVAIVDDHPVVVSGLEAALGRLPHLEVVGHAGTLAEARPLLARDDVDVALVDMRLPDGHGTELIAPIAARGRPAIIMLSTFETPQYVAAAVRLGARGFLLKTAPLATVVEAIERVATGGTSLTADQLRQSSVEFVRLTPRDRQILGQLVGGSSNLEIAGRLQMSPKTVETHLRTLFARFGVTSRTELAIRAEREGWLELDEPG